MNKSQLLAFATGMVTGMGNGSVFVVTMNHFLGRAPFDTAGLWGFDAYNPFTYAGFEDFLMIIFGLAFWAMLASGLKKFAAVEGQPTALTDHEAIADANGR